MFRNHQYMYEHYRPTVSAYLYIRVSTYRTCTIFWWAYTVLDRALWEISATRSTIGTNTPHRRAISPHFHNLHHQTLRLSQGKLNLFVIVVNLMCSRIWLDVSQNITMNCSPTWACIHSLSLQPKVYFFFLCVSVRTHLTFFHWKSERTFTRHWWSNMYFIFIISESQFFPCFWCCIYLTNI
jgi:hypothetical protein